MSVPGIGRIGIWSTELRFGAPAETAQAAAELDELGYGAIGVTDRNTMAGIVRMFDGCNLAVLASVPSRDY